MGSRFEFSVEARGGQAEAALRRLLELLRGTAEAGLRDLDAPPLPGQPERPRPLQLKDTEPGR